MKYSFKTLEEAVNYLVDNSKILNSSEVTEIKKYIKERFNLDKMAIVDILVKAINKRRELKD